MTKLQEWAVNARPLSLALARCYFEESQRAWLERRAVSTVRLATLERLFRQLSPIDQIRCRDESTWLHIQHPELAERRVT